MSGGEGEESRDLYRVLGIEPNATAEEIRKAARQLLARFHPDRNPNDPKAAVRFKRVVAAYEVLGDARKREAYDELTRPIEDHDEPAPAPRTGTPPPDPPPPRARTSNPPPPRPSTPPPPTEHVLVEDRFVRVSSWRLSFATGVQYWLRDLDGVAMRYEGRDLIAATCGSLMVGQAIVLFASDASNAGKLSLFIGASALGRFLFKAPKTWLVVRIAGRNVDLTSSPSLAWVRDVARATHTAMLGAGKRNELAPDLGIDSRAPSLPARGVLEEVAAGAATWLFLFFLGYAVSGALDWPSRSSAPDTLSTHTAEPERYEAPSPPPPPPAPTRAAPRPQRISLPSKPVTPVDPCAGDDECRCNRASTCIICKLECMANSTSSAGACAKYCLLEPAPSTAPTASD